MKSKKFRLEENEIPIREGVFLFPKNEDDSPQLIGSRCRACGDVVFPKRHLCTVCDSRERMEEILLGEKGTLHTFTVVRMGYPHFDLPYILGLVDLPEGRDLQVLAQIEDCDPSELRIGMPLKLTLGKIKTDPRTGKTVHWLQVSARRSLRAGLRRGGSAMPAIVGAGMIRFGKLPDRYIEDSGPKPASMPWSTQAWATRKFKQPMWATWLSL